eukprot:UN22912
MMKEQTLENILKTSSKLTVLKNICQIIKNAGEIVLIFSKLRKTMVLIHKVLIAMDFKFLSIDGTIDSIQRQKYINTFNNTDEHFAFCSTTGVGGLGITLTGASRVIIYDPDWNPANDSQAVDRAYRLGQTKNVVVYRLVTCETIEDKIYRRQVSKKGLLEMMNHGGQVK